MPPPSYIPLIEHVRAKYQAACERVDNPPPPVFQTTIQGLCAPGTREVDRSPGDLRIDLLFTTLTQIEENVNKCSRQQQLCIHMFFASALPHIVGHDEFVARMPYYLNRMKQEQYHHDCWVRSQRRVGKTVSVAYTVCVLLYVIPKYNIAIFAAGMRQTMNMLKYVQETCEQTPCLSKCLVRPGSMTRVRLEGESSKDIRTCTSYPATPKVMLLRVLCARTIYMFVGFV